MTTHSHFDNGSRSSVSRSFTRRESDRYQRPSRRQVGGLGSTIEFYAVDDVADPANRGSYDGGSSIPAPSSLDDWVAEMPITVVDRTETEIAGIDATRWVWELDVERIEGQKVARLWNLDSDAAPVLEAFDGETPQRVVWEVPHPDGDLLLVTMLLDGPSEMLDWAETILADVSFL